MIHIKTLKLVTFTGLIIIIIISAGLMLTEARGNYLPEPPYILMRDKDLSHSSHSIDTTCWQLFRPAINTAHFYFFVAEVMSNYLTTDGLKKISLLPEAP